MAWIHWTSLVRVLARKFKVRGGGGKKRHLDALTRPLGGSGGIYPQKILKFRTYWERLWCNVADSMQYFTHLGKKSAREDCNCPPTASYDPVSRDGHNAIGDLQWGRLWFC